MSERVLDASAVLALILCERGAEHVESLLPGSCVSAVNFAEVLSRLADNGMLSDDVVDDISQLNIEVVPFDETHASLAAILRPSTKRLGLSLGDRCCLALAIDRGAVAVTADKQWKEFRGCKVELIR